MKWDGITLRKVIESASGKRPADLVIRNCNVVNVFTGRVELVDLAVAEGFVLGWGDYEAPCEVDAGGAYAAPGFIDGHIHIESSLLGPAAFCAASAPWGTSAVVADPHEIANVLGLPGIRFMLDATEGAPLDVFINLPSCVPATGLETSGADLRATDLATLLPHPRILGLAEMMNFPGVLFTVPEVLDKLLLFQGSVLDGHAPLLSGRALNAYLATGVSSDHECTNVEEAREKLSKGMAIMIREGSQSKDMASLLLPLVDDSNWNRFLLVSDDRHPDDLLRTGHMNAIVNRAMELGLDPVRAISLATWTPARHFNLRARGALAPGYLADFSLSPTLTPWRPERVFRRGIEIARDGRLLDEGAFARAFAPTPPASPMRMTPPRIEDLRVPAEPGSLRVIGMMERSLLTRKLPLPPRIEGGAAVSDPERDILKIAVFNRYEPNHPPAVGFIRGLGLRRGALGTTVAHDSHNLLVAGVSDEDMITVVEALRECRGGMAIGSRSDGVLTLPLPIAGLMTNEPAEAVVPALEGLKERAALWGSRIENPFMALSFMALPVIPELKLTDRGLVDVTTFAFVSLFEP